MRSRRPRILVLSDDYLAYLGFAERHQGGTDGFQFVSHPVILQSFSRESAYLVLDPCSVVLVEAAAARGMRCITISDVQAERWPITTAKNLIIEYIRSLS